MSENKTKPGEISVSQFVDSITNEARKQEAQSLINLFHRATGARAVMWGKAIVGFGYHHYVYESGREGDTPAVGFAIRKNALTFYGIIFYEQNKSNLKLLNELGPHSTGKGCLYIKKLRDVDLKILVRMITGAYADRNNSKES